MSKKSLQQQWQEVCNDYLREFCHRHDYTYDPQYWIGSPEGIGTIAGIGDTMFVDKAITTNNTTQLCKRLDCSRLSQATARN